MKKTTDRKELQAKLNRLIGEFVTSVTKADSKKIRKAIKKASKLVAKAVSKKTGESELELSLKETTPAKKAPVVSRKKTARKRTTTSAGRSKSRTTPAVSSFKPVKTVTKTEASPISN